MKYEYNGGFVVIETTHFSTYILTSDKLAVGVEATFTYGNINDDASINTQDAVLIKKYLAGYDIVLGQ